MRPGLALAILMLPLTGCYVPQPEYTQPSYPPPGYPPPPGYAQPAYPPPGYPQPGYDPYGNVYPGYSENGGAPSLLVDGAVVPLIVVGGSWGYWDAHHNWHRAPDRVERHLEEQHAAGGGFHGGGYPRPGPEGHPFPPGEPNRGQPPFHPQEQGRPGPVPSAAGRPQPEREERRQGRDCPAGQRC